MYETFLLQFDLENILKEGDEFCFLKLFSIRNQQI